MSKNPIDIHRYVTIDVFTADRYQGNPLAVVLDADGLAPAQMQAIAREFNYVESTFVMRPEVPGHTARVRIFTPVREIPFAGHPNIGTALVLALLGEQDGFKPAESFIFEQQAGLVHIDLDWRNGIPSGAELVCPEPFSRHGQLTAEEAASCLSLRLDDIRTDRHLPQVASVGLPFLLVELASLDALRRARFEKAAHSRVLPLDGAHSIYAYTQETCLSEPETDLHARMFTGYGVEDPATGSATAAASGLQAELRGTAKLNLCIRQGVDMGRPSTLFTKVNRELDGTLAVKLYGRGIIVMDGNVRVPQAAYSDEAGHPFRHEAGQPFRIHSGHDSGVKPAISS